MNKVELDVATFDEESFKLELADEALERMAQDGQSGAYTLGACTGLSVCPG